ncbi:MAG TPA: nitroreductase family protein [Anaerovoracaceae bacterium]|nr:nitroreductase family protein [Anaerovoracaceae bacterium]
MNTLDCIKTRRSTRRYTDQEVPGDILKRLVEFGTLAPTADGLEPWSFVVVQGTDKVTKLSDLVKAHIAANSEKYPQFADHMKPVLSKTAQLFFRAPGLVLIYGDTGSYWYRYDCSLAAANIILAAHEIGLGSCWVGYAEPYFNSPEGRKLFDIPDSRQMVAAITIGFPEKALPLSTRREAKIHMV